MLYRTVPFAQPERGARRPLVEHEELLVATDLPVVALLGFFDPRQVFLELLLGQERRAVHALHRLIARVTLPVRVRRAEQLERFQLSGRGDVRADAEVDERLLVLDRVAGDLALTFRLLLDQLDLERLAAVAKEALGLVARPHLALEDQVLVRELAHLLLDGLEILRDERPRHDEVVEEALVGRRTNAALHTGEHVRHGSRQQMRGTVAIERERVGRVLRRDDLHRRVGGQRKREIDQPISDLSCERRVCQPRRDQRRQIADRRARRHTTARSIWQRHADLRHSKVKRSKVKVQRKLEPWPCYLQVSGSGRRGWTRTTDLLRVREAL